MHRRGGTGWEPESATIRSATDPQRSAQKCQREMQCKSQDKQKAPADTLQITYA